MKQLLYLLTSFLLLSISVNAADDCWELTWQDEFSSNALNTTYWSYVNNNDRGNVYHSFTHQCNTAGGDNLYVANGKLYMVAKREFRTCPNNKEQGTPKNYLYTSSDIFTKGKFDQKYGRFEARLKLPTANGIWPAFWLSPKKHPNDGSWPTGGEIDIMEMWGARSEEYGAAVWYGTSNNTYNVDEPKYRYPNGSADEFHIYAVEWEEGELRFYIDDYLLRTVNPCDLVDENLWPFDDEEFFIRLSLLVGGFGNSNEPLNNGSDFPQTMEVDYVRVYKKIGACEEEPPTCNLVRYGDFSESIQWEVYENTSTNVNWGITNTNWLELDIQNGGSSKWKVQATQRQIELEQGTTYRLRYDALALNNKNIDIKLTDDGDNISYFVENETIGTAWKEYEYEFTMNAASTCSGRLNFHLGGNNHNIYLDNVSLEAINCDEPVPPPPVNSCEILSNGSFNDGSKDWDTYKNSSVIASPSFNNDASFNISNGGTSQWRLQLIQRGLMIEKGATYQVSWKAKAAANKSIYLKASNATDNIKYAQSYVSIGTSWKDYSYTFTMNAATDNNARLNFGIGGNNTDIDFDDISLVKLNCDDDPVTDCNMLENDSFDDGKNGWTEYVNSNANASLTTNLGYANYAISNGGYKDWHVQLSQKNIELAANKTYLISCLVKASGYKNAKIELSDAISPHAIYYTDELPITTKWERKYFVYESDINDVNARLVFNFGKNTGNIYIDDVVVQEVDCGDFNNLVKNGYFQNGLNSWSNPYVNSNATATWLSNDNGINFIITNDGYQAWHIQHLQKGINLEAGATYTISFKAKATANRSIMVELSNGVSPHTGYLYKTMNLDTDLSTYHVTFTAPQSNTNARLVFNMGNNSANVILDDVVMVKETHINNREDQSSLLMTNDFPKIAVSPNPFNDVLSINIEDNEEQAGHYALYDIQGRLVIEQAEEINPNYIELVTTNLENGIYILKVTLGDKTVTRKLVK